MLGTFDLNQDGVPECISTTEIQEQIWFKWIFTIAIWGDDAITDPIDGLLEAQVLPLQF